MILNKVDKKVQMDHWDIVRFQLTIYCFLNRIHLSDHDLACVALLGASGEQTLEDFCALCKEKEIFSSNQSARNALSKAEKRGLIIKEGRNKKKIKLNPAIGVQATGNILLSYNIFHLEPIYESQEG